MTPGCRQPCSTVHYLSTIETENEPYRCRNRAWSLIKLPGAIPLARAEPPLTSSARRTLITAYCIGGKNHSEWAHDERNRRRDQDRAVGGHRPCRSAIAERASPGPSVVNQCKNGVAFSGGVGASAAQPPCLAERRTRGRCSYCLRV